MKPTRWMILSIAGVTLGFLSASAVITAKTFRTTGLFYTFTQGHAAATILAGRNLANLAAGRSATSTAQTNQVLALTFRCDYSAAQLVVYDQTNLNIVADIADTISLETVTQQDANTNRPDHVRFLAEFKINPTGTASNGLLGGYLTVAGRIHANLTNGCPEAVAVKLDRDAHDKPFGDKDVSVRTDPDPEKLSKRAGLAHLTGVIETVQAGITNTLLIPAGQLSLRGAQP